MSLEDRHDRASELFRRALELIGKEREEFLRGECGADDSLYQLVCELLVADAQGGPADALTPTGRVFATRGRAQPRPSDGPRARAGESIGEFELVELIGRGGMGEVWSAEQATLSRRVALKLVRPESVNERTLALFSREARAGGRLSHPGIVAVHGRGESDGIAWIAMELVHDGWTLRDSLDAFVRAKELPGDYCRCAADLVAKLADAMQAAHEAGVIHRDLKPQNVLITTEGDPKVTDFGLARITDETALSHSGDIAGTYAYMSPEQVVGRRSRIDHRTDIFSLGVLMYEMLALRRPFEGDTAQQIAHQIMRVDPPDLRSRRSRIPRNLAVICGKCLEKDPAHRFASMAEVAADVRRALSNEPIRAKPPGRIRKLHLWALRNPTKSLSGAVALLALAVISVMLGQNLRANRVLASTNSHLTEQTRVAEMRTAEVLRLSALQDFEDLVERADLLWPPHPDNIDPCAEWIKDAQTLVRDLPLHLAKRNELRTMALSRAGGQGPWLFPDSESGRETKWWHREISELIESLEGWIDPAAGLLSEEKHAVSTGHGWSVPRRMAFAGRLRDSFGPGGAYRGRWSAARREIRAHPAYEGLELSTQTGIVPIGPDESSGLWEFWHVATGAEPARAADGRLELTEETGLVLVLIPGGTFLMGAQAVDPAEPNYDPQATPDEGPVHEVRLSPFFLSKYEMTQGQWSRFVGSNPSFYQPPSPHALTLLHPVERASWFDWKRELERMGLTLPTEAQWEYGCRASTDTAWWSGAERDSLRRAVNLADLAAKRAGMSWSAISEWTDLDDGFAMHAPVGTYRANLFGLHETPGNVREWCLDGYDSRFYARSPQVDPLASWENAEQRVFRGSCFVFGARGARSASRASYAPSFAVDRIGTRPARNVEP